jgi:phosphatidate cytidylyltransferase
MGNLAKRFATAAVLVPAVLAAIYFDPSGWAVAIFAAAVAGASLDEYLRMALPANEEDPAWLLRIATGAFGAAIVILPSRWTPGEALPPLLTAAAVGLGFVTLARPKHLAEAGRHFGVCLSGLVYIPLLMCVLPLLVRSGHQHWITVTLCMAFFSDTVAYFFGRAWGKQRLYEAVSPKKTIQGSVGGILGSVMATTLVGMLWLIPDLPLWHAIVLGILGSVVGQAGDLVESMLKRTYGVKDSGNLLPGHGGMLDRTDAALYVAPLVYYYVALVA